MMNTEKLIELCDEIEREAYDIVCYTLTSAMCGHIQAILARVKDIRSAVGEQSEPHHAYWIPTECGVKCSSCDTEYADSNYSYMMYQCPHCFAEMGETRKSQKTNGDRIRHMSDEELAEIVRFALDCEDCTFHGGNGCSGDCYAGAISWLGQEVHEDD